jgi:tetratricopeptide (TPR) repeat protein
VSPLFALLLLAAEPAAPAPTLTSTPTSNPTLAPTPTPTPMPTSNTAPAPVPTDPAARLERANALYLGGDFQGAARAYRSLVDEGYEGPSLHLNLGNALVRAGARGQAMASYERALRLDPGDADARANLELARAANPDRLVGAAEPSLAGRLVERTGDGLAVGLFGAAWIGLWALLWLRGRATRRARRLLGPAALLAALAAAAAGGLVAAKAVDRRTPSAVVVARVAPVREGPERALRSAFELHEGTLVRVVEARGDQARVKLENGLTGWVASADLEVI